MKSSSFYNLLTFWRRLFGETNPGILSHQRWKKNPACPKPSHTSKNELSAKVINVLESLTISAKSSMWTGFWIRPWSHNGCLWTESHWVNISRHATQLFIDNIVSNFEKPSTKDMRNKRIPSKHLTAQSQTEEIVRHVQI